MSDNPQFCSGCGQKLAANSHFCPSCGAESQVRRPIPDEAQPTGSAPRIGVIVVLVGSGLLGLILIILLVMANQPAAESTTPTQPPTLAGAGVPSPPTPAPIQEQAAKTVIPSTKKNTFPEGLLVTPSNIEKKPPTTNPKPGPSKHQIIKSSKFGFSFELPEHWEQHSENNTLFLSPRDDSPESKEIWGDLQVITKTPQGTLRKQTDDLKEQLKGLKNLMISLEETTDFSGQPASYLVTHYFQEAVETNYVGIWIIVERGPYYYWLSFHIQQEQFDEHSPIIEHVLKTFQFSPINQSK